MTSVPNISRAISILTLGNEVILLLLLLLHAVFLSHKVGVLLCISMCLYLLMLQCYYPAGRFWLHCCLLSESCPVSCIGISVHDNIGKNQDLQRFI